MHAVLNIVVTDNKNVGKLTRQVLKMDAGVITVFNVLNSILIILINLFISFDN